MTYTCERKLNQADYGPITCDHHPNHQLTFNKRLFECVVVNTPNDTETALDQTLDMKVNIYTRVILNSIIALFFSSRLIHSVSSLSSVDHPPADPVEVLLGNTFTITRNLTGPVAGLLRIRERTRARDPPAEDHPPESSRLPDVSVSCSSAGLVLRVKRGFYGLSAAPEELTLGETCRSNGAREPQNDLLFTYTLTDCHAELHVHPEYMIYKNVLHYVPLSNRHFFRSLNVGVECRVNRHHHVHSEVVRPTWRVPLHKSIRSRLGGFRIQLMDDSWSSPVRSAVYMLGQRINVQVSTQHQYPGVKLFINSCYVTTTHQTTKYSIIDNFGCLRESQINPDARFRSFSADNVVQFSFGAFQFIEAPDAQVSLHCELFVSGGDSSPAQKSCFYNHVKNRWISVFGHDLVCSCCDSVCNHTKAKRLIYEGFVSSDQVVISDPVTFPFSTLTSSPLDSTLLTHDNDNDDDDVWFKVKLAKEHQRSHNHKDFAASVSLRSSEDHVKTQNQSHTNTKTVMEGEKQADVEILMATSESFVRSDRSKVKETRQKVDSVERDISLGWSEHRTRQNLVKGQSYWSKKDLEKGKVPIKMSGVINTTEEKSRMDDDEPQELILSSLSADKDDENFKNKEKNLGFRLYLENEQKSEFLVGLDDLMEQGVVRKLDLTKEPDDYFISEEM